MVEVSNKYFSYMCLRYLGELGDKFSALVTDGIWRVFEERNEVRPLAIVLPFRINWLKCNNNKE